jgi:hypothetical protein
VLLGGQEENINISGSQRRNSTFHRNISKHLSWKGIQVCNQNSVQQSSIPLCPGSNSEFCGYTHAFSCTHKIIITRGLENSVYILH